MCALRCPVVAARKGAVELKGLVDGARSVWVLPDTLLALGLLGDTYLAFGIVLDWPANEGGGGGKEVP